MERLTFETEQKYREYFETRVEAARVDPDLPFGHERTTATYALREAESELDSALQYIEKRKRMRPYKIAGLCLALLLLARCRQARNLYRCQQAEVPPK